MRLRSKSSTRLAAGRGFPRGIFPLAQIITTISPWP